MLHDYSLLRGEVRRAFNPRVRKFVIRYGFIAGFAILAIVLLVFLGSPFAVEHLLARADRVDR